MAKRISRKIWLTAGILILFLLAAVGGWWYFRMSSRTGDMPPASPVLVTLLSPSSGDEVEAGDYVAVMLHAVAPEAIQSLELFVDGSSLGESFNSPESATWSWRAWPVGIHTFSARARTVSGLEGMSQTVIVNVLAGDGVMQFPAAEGQTLEQIGAAFGVPPDQMANTNQDIDPSQPLSDGQPVQVPNGSGPDAGALPGAPPSGLPLTGGAYPGGVILPFTILWQLAPSEPVDRPYCYISTVEGVWERIPSAPFAFFSGVEPIEHQTYGLRLPPVDEAALRVECWAWVGEALVFLGQGETSFNPQQIPDVLSISAVDFTLTGSPQIDIEPVTLTGGPNLTVPAPFALRQTIDSLECSQHFGGPTGDASFMCDTLLNAQVQQHAILVWEWTSQLCWPGNCPWLNDIIGYVLYEVDPSTQWENPLVTIEHPQQQVAAAPLPWGYKCYGVRAYAEHPSLGLVLSDRVTFCPGEAPVPEVLALNPVEWITTGGKWIQSGDCDTYGGADTYLATYQNSGFDPGEVLVGSGVVDDDEQDCFRQGDYSGGLRFEIPALPSGAVLHRAFLTLSESYTTYKATGVATNYKLFCVSEVGQASQSWSGLGGEDHFLSGNLLSSSAYYNPLTTISGWDSSPEVNVTSVVNHWMTHPAQNHGFVLAPRSALYPAADGTGSCYTVVTNAQLVLHYFVP